VGLRGGVCGWSSPSGLASVGGEWDVPNYLGRLAHRLVANTFRSANCVGLQFRDSKGWGQVGGGVARPFQLLDPTETGPLKETRLKPSVEDLASNGRFMNLICLARMDWRRTLKRITERSIMSEALSTGR